MARLTQEQRQAATRRKLLESARELFARDGYGGTSIEAISDNAGYSKGAFYPNFTGKEAIFLEVLKQYSDSGLTELLASLDGSTSVEDAIERVARWADDRSRDGNWSLLLLEYVRHAKQNDHFGREQEQILKAAWIQLGQRLASIGEADPGAPEILGAIVFELVFAPAMTFMTEPTAGDLVRFALTAMLRKTP